MMPFLRDRQPKAVRKEASERYLPEFVGFNEEQTVWLRGVLSRLDIPLFPIKRFRYDPDHSNLPASAAAAWEPTTREIIIAPVMGEHAHLELARKLIHELTHAVFDPNSYAVRDENFKAQYNEDGTPQFMPEVWEVFQDYETIKAFEIFKFVALYQALRSEEYLAGYQAFLAHKLQERYGQRHLLAVQESDPNNTPEQNADIVAQAEGVARDIETLEYIMYEESWAITMEYAFFNPKALAIKTKAQKSSWNQNGIPTEDMVLGMGGTKEFIDTDVLALRFLQKFLNTDAQGIKKRRKAVREFLQDETLYPGFLPHIPEDKDKN